MGGHNVLNHDNILTAKWAWYILAVYKYTVCAASCRIEQVLTRCNLRG